MSKNIFKQHLNEYVMYNNVHEADDDTQQNQQPGMGPGASPTPNAQSPMGEGGPTPPQGGPQPGGMDMGEAPMGGPQPGGMDMGEAPMGGPQPNGMDMGEAPMGGDMQQPDIDMDAIPDAQMDGNDIEDVEMEDGIGPEQPGDEVIDVDDLTQSQQAAEYKIDGVSDKITTLGAVVDKFIKALELNNRKIEDLKQEFEKRNPTDEERINLRSMSSVPYMQTPRDYWEGVRAKNPNYNIMSNNLVDPKDEQQEFELRKSDLKGGDDRSVYDSFEYPTDLKDILDF